MTRTTTRGRRLTALRGAPSPDPSPALLAAVAPYAEDLAERLREGGNGFALARVKPAYLGLTWAIEPEAIVRVARGLGLEPGSPPVEPAALVVAAGACVWLTADALERAARETTP